MSVVRVERVLPVRSDERREGHGEESEVAAHVDVAVCRYAQILLSMLMAKLAVRIMRDALSISRRCMCMEGEQMATHQRVTVLEWTRSGQTGLSVVYGQGPKREGR